MYPKPARRRERKNWNNGTTRPNNMHKARQVTGAETPEGTDDEAMTTKSAGPLSRAAMATKTTT